MTDKKKEKIFHDDTFVNPKINKKHASPSKNSMLREKSAPQI